jgi:hypothetical protein
MQTLMRSARDIQAKIAPLLYLTRVCRHAAAIAQRSLTNFETN